MRTAACVIAPLLVLGACDNSPKVDLHNATGNEVAQAVKQSGMMTGDTMVEPGLWQSKVTILEMNIPGMPAGFADKMKQSMAEHQQQSSKHCLTKEDVKKPKEGFFAGRGQVLPLCPFHHGRRQDGHPDGMRHGRGDPDDRHGRQLHADELTRWTCRAMGAPAARRAW